MENSNPEVSKPTPTHDKAFGNKPAEKPVRAPSGEAGSPAPDRKERRKSRSKDHGPYPRDAKPDSADHDTSTQDVIDNPDSYSPKPDKILDDNELWAWDKAAEHLNGGYLYKTGEDISDVRQKLSETRLVLAESSVKARRGTLLSNSKRSTRQLEEAEAAYDEARQAFIEEELSEFGRAKTSGQKEAYLAALSAHEDGALMATESHYYMSKEDTKLQRGVEWYKGLSKTERIAYGIGASAVVAVVGGLTLGAAAGGAIVGTRIGKGYLNREARRTKDIEVSDEEIKEALKGTRFADNNFDGSIHKAVIYKRTRRELQRGKLKLDKYENASLRQSNQDDHDQLLSRLNGYKSPNKKTLLSAVDRDVETRRDGENTAYQEAITSAKIEAKAKRKSLAMAVGFAALGGAAGHFVEYGPRWHGLIGNHDQIQDNINGTDHDATIGQQRIVAGQQLHPTQVQETLAGHVSPRSEHLYGEFAGKNVNLKIPEGSNVWDQLEKKVALQNPHASYSERERLTGNLLNSMKQQYPHRDLSLVQPGDHFSFSPNPKAR